MARKRQLGVALGGGLRDLLEKLAGQTGRSIADEIRERVLQTIELDALVHRSGPDAAAEIKHRLALTLEEEKFDPPTRELARDVRELANEVERQSGGLPWHLHPRVCEALAEALQKWIEINKPTNTENAAASDLLGPADDPQTLGRSIARSYQRQKAIAWEMRDRLRREREHTSRIEAEHLRRHYLGDQLKTIGSRKRKGQKS